MRCPLCEGSTKEFYREEREFVRCTICKAIILLPQYYLNAEEEEKRYRLHNNDVEDVDYLQFVSPITDAVQKDFPTTSIGLDYGCGTGPVASVFLEKLGYNLKLYDPFFEDHPEVLKQKYNFIMCCEVMEHFHHPRREFELLKSLLHPGGKLYCKTSIYLEEKDFANWYYKNDPTHVFIYTEETLHWIKTNIGFTELQVQPKLIVFTN